MQSSSVRFAALCALTLLVIGLGYALLSSSDFPRGLFKPPAQDQQSQYFDSLICLNPNYVHTDASSWEFPLDDYVDLLNQYDLKVVLKRANTPQGYLEQKYSNSQYMEYQAEWKNDGALLGLWNLNGTGYYFFEHDGGGLYPGQPGGGASWYFSHDTCSAGWRLEGPRHITNPTKGYISDEWKPGWPQGGAYSVYKHRISARATTTGLPTNTVIFKLALLHVYRHPLPSEREGVESPPDDAQIITYGIDTLEVTAGDFGGSSNFLQFSLPVAEGVGDTAWKLLPPDTSFVSCYYNFYWSDQCNVWIDKIETTDMERGYNFLWTDSARQEKLDSLYDEGLLVQDTCGTTLEGFSQSDTPRRISFLAHRAVNDTMRNGLKPGYAYFRNDNLLFKRTDHFIYTSHPQIFELYEYPFTLDTTCGAQVELDTLAARLEYAY